MLAKSISFNSLLLGGFALLTAGTLATVNLFTQAPIAEAERAAARKALLEILPPATHNNAMLEDTLPLTPEWQQALNAKNDAVIYRARKDNDVVGVIIPATAPDGYSGNIHLIVGINKNLSVAGVRVVAHAETPGLGDKIETKKSDWILAFNETSLDEPAANHWRVKKDGGHFDQFTGATITPRAVVRQVKQVIEFAERNHDVLFRASNEANP
ncbi:electron transport complex subunit RsxG [Simiduia sp. 21SJ11W-1]|uniref:electron transport complex subunit RsxG n=1 Tax=Simiduia sp. 21SJ11W-1 TaxID=2909669 RepID=UPI0020A10B1E|nr:electron transport complex subunit RsxG [Simiduia sp. 21SJ11W-1]UTA47001.1 electron transport complex subunit RsxG [Simiduia sp. 21SJ11W-1]